MNWMINRKMATGAFAATVAACGFVDAREPYANNFSERTSETIPSDRWCKQQTSLIPSDTILAHGFILIM